MVFRYLFFLLTPLLLLQASCEKPEPKGPELICLEEYSIEQQVTVGQAFGNAINQLHPILDKATYPEAYEYVEQLFRLAIETPEITGRSDYAWQITIINDAETAAFILPDGHLYIHKGLLQFLEAENQLIALMAHELAYIENEIIINRWDSKFDCIPLGDIILDNGKADVLEMALDVPDLGLDSTQVLLADSFSVDLMCPFVYAPQGIASILQKSIELNDDLKWLENRPGISEVRIPRINSLSDECGMAGPENRAEYQFFLANWLPE